VKEGEGANYMKHFKPPRIHLNRSKKITRAHFLQNEVTQ
jgi:hypothetical protein